MNKDEFAAAVKLTVDLFLQGTPPYECHDEEEWTDAFISHIDDNGLAGSEEEGDDDEDELETEDDEDDSE